MRNISITFFTLAILSSLIVTINWYFHIDFLPFTIVFQHLTNTLGLAGCLTFILSLRH